VNDAGDLKYGSRIVMPKLRCLTPGGLKESDAGLIELECRKYQLGQS